MTPTHALRAPNTASADVWLVLRSASALPVAGAAQGALSEHRTRPLPDGVADQLRTYLTSTGGDPVEVEVEWGLARVGHLLPSGARPVGVIVEGTYAGSDWLDFLDPAPQVLEQLMAATADPQASVLRAVVITTERVNADPLHLRVVAAGEPLPLDGGLPRHLVRQAASITVIDPDEQSC